MMAILSLLVPLAVYQLTLAPSVTFFDSGEFITAIHSLGSAHSPGYPLFINYSKPFTYLPFGNIAFRVNIATAFSAAMACYVVYLLVSKLLEGEEMANEPNQSRSHKKTIALSAALIFAFSSRVWLQSNHDKPYLLISFLGAMVFYLLFIWRERYRRGEECPSYIYLCAFICGLAFAAHQTMVLLLPSYLFLILSMDLRIITRFKENILSVVFALIGFSIHLHMPIRATQKPLLNWGDPQTLAQFLWHFLRRGYPVETPHRDLPLFRAQMNSFNIPHEFTWVGLTLLLIGLFTSIRKRRDEVLAYLIGVVFFLLVIIGYLNTPAEMIFLTEEFFTPIYLLTAVFIGLGIFSLLKAAIAGIVYEKLGTLVIRVMALITIFALPVSVCAINYRENDQHENYIAHDYAANTMLALPERAILYTWGDSGAFPLWYMQGVERMREDLSIVHTPHLYFPWYLDTFPDLFKHSSIRTANLKGKSSEFLLERVISEQFYNRPIYIDFSTRYSIQLANFRLHQQGICYRLERERKGEFLEPDIAIWDLFSLRGTNGRLFFWDLDTSKAVLIYAYSRMEGGETLLHLGHSEEGSKQLLMAEKMAPELKSQIDEALSANQSE